MISLSKAKEASLRIICSRYFIVAFLLIFSGFIRFNYLNAGLYHHDSFQAASAIEKSVDEGRLYGIGGGRYGYILANTAFFYFFKNIFSHTSAEFTLNFTSALFGTLSVIFLYLLIKAMANDRFLAFSSAILYSTTPLFLSVSTFAKEHTLDALIVISSLYLLAKGIDKNDFKWIFSAGILFSLIIFVRFPSILAVFAAISMIYAKKSKDSVINDFMTKNKHKIAAVYASPLIAVLGAYLLFFSSAFANEAASNFDIASIENVKNLVMNNFMYSAGVLVFSLSIFGILLAMAGFVVIFRENRQLFYFSVLFFVLLFLFYGASRTVADRFFSLAMMPLTIGLAYAISYVKKRNVYVGAVLLIIFTSAFFWNIYPVIKFRSNYSAFRELGILINDNTSPGDSAIIVYGDDAPAIDYYSKTPVRTCEYDPTIGYVMQLSADIAGLMLDDIKVYISGSCFGLGTMEEKEFFLSEIARNFRGAIVAEYVTDDYHRGAIMPTIRKVPLIRLYSRQSQKGSDLREIVRI